MAMRVMRAAAAPLKDAEDYVFRARKLVEKGLMEEAITDCTSAIDRDPTCVSAWAVRGECHEALGDMQSALNDYNRVHIALSQGVCSSEILMPHSGDIAQTGLFACIYNDCTMLCCDGRC
jgi:tetratricopeptide (TPR) repeat protein